MDLQLFKHLQNILTEDRIARFKQILNDRTRHFTVVTEDIYQMHNASAVMRTCDVFGIQDMHVVEERLGKKMDREIAMGAQKWVSLTRHNSMQKCISDLKKDDYQIVATTPHKNGKLLTDFDYSRKSAFFFGKENVGLSETVLNEADEYLKIPMFGFSESLNISVSAAIILQYAATELRKTKLNWHLSEDEKLEIELQWTKNTIKNVDKIIERFYETQNS